MRTTTWTRSEGATGGLTGADHGGQRSQPRSTDGDPEDAVLAALDHLEVALEQNARDEEMLAGRIVDLRRALRDGVSLQQALRAEQQPGTLQLVSRVHGRISEGSGTLRRSVVWALREEGTSIPSIAELFGVTHQRVSNLLRHRS